MGLSEWLRTWEEAGQKNQAATTRHKGVKVLVSGYKARPIGSEYVGFCVNDNINGGKEATKPGGH